MQHGGRKAELITLYWMLTGVPARWRMVELSEHAGSKYRMLWANIIIMQTTTSTRPLWNSQTNPWDKSSRSSDWKHQPGRTQRSQLEVEHLSDLSFTLRVQIDPMIPEIDPVLSWVCNFGAAAWKRDKIRDPTKTSNNPQWPSDPLWFHPPVWSSKVTWPLLPQRCGSAWGAQL